MSTRAVISEVTRERARQDLIWGQQNHPDGTARYLDDDIADLARRACELRAGDGTVTWRHILDEEVAEAFAERNPVLLRAELIQVAAVAVAWVEALDRRAAR